MIRINQIKLPLDYRQEDIYQAVSRKLHVPRQSLSGLQILRRSIDARKGRGARQDAGPVYQLSAAVDVKNEDRLLKRCRDADVSAYKPARYVFPYKADGSCKIRPVVIGLGPAGLFCALTLAQAGYRPIVFERGSSVQERIRKVNAFWEKDQLDEACNVQFGEGGAGTFSDGKLNTLVKDPQGLHRRVLEIFAAAGAPEDILYEHKPHIGSDLLPVVVANIRNEIIRLGGEVHFDSTVTDFLLDESGDLKGIKINDNDITSTGLAVLCPGHSARDTFLRLRQLGMHMEPKAFAIGVRIEHPQDMISLAQYKSGADKLPPADYKLTWRAADGRSVYSFCMCPGGFVVNASSEPGRTAVNGMSLRARDSGTANSALIVSVTPDDFDGDDPLSGMYFQRQWEEKAYAAGGGKVPIQLFRDFEEGQVSREFGEVVPRHKGAVSFADLHSCLPDYVCRDLIEAIHAFDRRIHGYSRPDAILSGVETRSSSPVRMPRNELLQSSIGGIIPCGEGAGYAGGITSAAMDGIRAAQAAARFIEEKTC